MQNETEEKEKKSIEDRAKQKRKNQRHGLQERKERKEKRISEQSLKERDKQRIGLRNNNGKTENGKKEKQYQ